MAKAMTAKEFNTLHKLVFSDYAKKSVRGEILEALKQREALLKACIAALKAMRKLSEGAGNVTEWNVNGFAFDAFFELSAAITRARATED